MWNNSYGAICLNRKATQNMFGQVLDSIKILSHLLSKLVAIQAVKLLKISIQ
jgi:hypothetical protein